MDINENILAVLSCPKCRGNIRKSDKKDCLVCDLCQHSFFIRDDVLVMLPGNVQDRGETINEKKQSKTQEHFGCKSPQMESVSHFSKMENQEVKNFWTNSVSDYHANSKTGIDISRNQDGYWRALDKWEKEIANFSFPDGIVLDIGCGTGRITKHLLSKNRNVMSADYIFEALVALKNSTPRAFCVNMDIKTIGLKDSSVGSIVSCRVLQSLVTKEEKRIAVKEFCRILKKGGKLILTEGNPLRTKLVPVPYNFYIGLAKWKKILAKEGMCIETIYGIPFLTLTKVLDKLSLNTIGRFDFPFNIASSLDRFLGRSFLKHISLQFDMVAVKM